MRILFLTQLFPYPPVCGGTIRGYNILSHLGQGHEVTLVAFVRKSPSEEQLDAVRSVCREVFTVPIKRSAVKNAKFAASSVARRESFIITRDYVPEMQETVDRLLSAEHFDLLYVDHLQMAQYVRDSYPCKKVLDEHNVEWKIIERIAKTERFSPKGAFAALEWRKLKQWELQACAKFDLVLTVTDHDKETLTSGHPRQKNVQCLPIGVDFSQFEEVKLKPGATDILSIGTMSWPPNIDSILYFTKSIYPAIKDRAHDARLVIVGKDPPESVKRLAHADKSIEITGFVQDIMPLASRAAAFIVPLRSGSGMRVKILNAMAMGLPIVSTSVGCEGIGVMHDEQLLIADTPSDFADAVLRLLCNYELRRRLGEAGRAFVLQNYGWERILSRLDSALETICSSGEAKQAS